MKVWNDLAMIIIAVMFAVIVSGFVALVFGCAPSPKPDLPAGHTTVDATCGAKLCYAPDQTP